MKPNEKAIRFLRPWGGRTVGAIGSPRDLTYGQRQTLVTYNFAEWVEPAPTRPKHNRQLQRETSE